MTRPLILILLVVALTLTACGGQLAATPTGELTRIRLPMGFIPNVQYAPYYVAVEKGYFREAGFEIEFDYSFETDGVALVGADNLPFALVSGEQVLLARAQGLPVVYVMAWYQQFPIAVVARTREGIATPQDLRGRKIGLPGLFGANYVGLRALLFSAGLKESDVTLEGIGFNQVEALVTGQSPVVAVYAANEPIQLRAQGIELNELRVADYVQLVSNGLITNEKTIAENPQLVSRFVQAALKGLADTIADPDEAFEISKKYVENLAQADQAVQKQVLETSIEMWKADILGRSDPAAWENMQKVLLDMGLYTQALDLDKAYSNDFVK